MKKLTIALFFVGGILLQAQEAKPAFERWFHANLATDSIYGVASDDALAYAKKQGLKASPVLVAVIDSGIDLEHEDLVDNLWVNEDEIPGNGLDDDNNGYADDIHGWNFIGGKDGNVNADTYEITRLVKKYGDLFDTKDEYTNETNRTRMPEEYEFYKEIKKEFEDTYAQNKVQYDGMMKQVEMQNQALLGFGKEYGMDKKISVEGLNEFQPQTEISTKIKETFLGMANTEGANELYGKTMNEFMEMLKEEIKKDPTVAYYTRLVEENYNLDFDPRPIVGDNFEDKTEKFYGNTDAEGPDAKHGTHVAGLIGAIRNNNRGMDGVAENVKIMSVRTVPNGDERDKDVANAIRYAVDNGAKIINMSFGKAYSPEKELVWEAMKYATDKGVLLVHAAGNDNKDIDVENNFPTNYFDGKEISNTWLTVGASTRYNDNIKASFSNFGKRQVDIFAPGLEMYATVPQSDYETLRGTSMAAPVVSGVAALVWSYYPSLTAAQLKQILIESGNVHPDLQEISAHGVVADALKALQLAAKVAK